MIKLDKEIDFSTLQPPSNDRKFGFYKVDYHKDGMVKSETYLNYLCESTEELMSVRKLGDVKWSIESKKERAYTKNLRKAFLDQFNDTIHEDMLRYYDHIRRLIILYSNSDVRMNFRKSHPTGGYHIQDFALFSARYFKDDKLDVDKLEEDYNKKCKAPLGRYLPTVGTASAWDCKQ
jgi:hypothetical protein